MAKSADAFRTISEVAGDLGIQKHVLRFWEVKFTQIRPMKRGGGRRYYRPEDMELLRGIRQLLHRDGYTIKGVQKILREQGVDAVKIRDRGDDEAPELAAVQPAGGAPPAEPAVTEDQAASPRADAGGRGRRGRGKAGAATGTAAGAGAIDRAAVLQSVITELGRCRDLLMDRDTTAAATGKAERRPRRAS